MIEFANISSAYHECYLEGGHKNDFILHIYQLILLMDFELYELFSHSFLHQVSIKLSFIVNL